MNLRCDEYEWNFDESKGRLTCKRHGLKWRDETGDGAVLALLQTAIETKELLESKLAKAVEALTGLKNAGVKISCLYIGSIEVNTKTRENIENEWVTALDKTYQALSGIKGE